jgi:predicted nucleic acid-binding Zn ribbon protein
VKGSSEGQNGPQAIGPIVKKIVSRLGLEGLATSSRVFEVWNSVVGPAIARHAQPYSLRDGTLIVNVESSVWLSQLDRYRKGQIKEKLNQSLPQPIVNRIIFRFGEVARINHE